MTFMVKVNHVGATIADQQPISVMSDEMKTEKKSCFKAQRTENALLLAV